VWVCCVRGDGGAEATERVAAGRPGGGGLGDGGGGLGERGGGE